ncbi:DUF4097 domain-containing protein [Paenibacillus sp. SYP-B3998]|uniref:DUF4097 domain-containing protein n=1 Tax=Paenibacillus sp. SYP-B3998 TaxID=2678564 RepID=A0A6G4A2X6_9BACL|nr:DUF4097 family beta strand repeat-containing protein [Paenibacillus sp. SYP-B3998]NEW08823.1 DUF4097 domain-containing protein [Paenibacillus sp. SYP-B3998]
MKRGAKFFLLVGFACLAVGIVGAAVSFKDTDFKAGTTTIDIEKKIAATNIDTLTIQNEITGVTFIPSDTDEISVHLIGTVTKNRANECTIDAVTEGSNAWRVNVCKNKKIRFSFNLDELKDAIANFDNQLRTEVKLPNKLYKEIKVSSGTGSLNLKEVKAETLTASTDTGSIKVDRYEGKQLDLESDTGRITVVEGQGNVRLRTSTGNIHAKLHDIGDTVSLDADTGNIELQLSPPPTSASFDLSTDIGSVTLDIAGVNITESARSTVIGTLGDGRKKVTVSTDTGSVTVTDK